MHASRRSRTLALALALALATATAPAAQAAGLTSQLYTWSASGAAFDHALQWVRSFWDFGPRAQPPQGAPRLRTVKGNDGIGIDPNGHH